MTTDVAATQISARNRALAMAPLITMGTTWVVRRALIKGYEATTGNPAPLVHNQQAPMLSRVLWAATLAASAAAVEIVVWRFFYSGED